MYIYCISFNSIWSLKMSLVYIKSFMGNTRKYKLPLILNSQIRLWLEGRETCPKQTIFKRRGEISINKMIYSNLEK